MMDLDYVLPLRWDDDSALEALTAYLRRLSRNVRIVVVDGSPAALFDRHAAHFHCVAGAQGGGFNIE